MTEKYVKVMDILADYDDYKIEEQINEFLEEEGAELVDIRMIELGDYIRYVIIYK